ncbi:MFS transporter [Corynebacterium ulceribovis]|uniref:MFS transporter n=1 Tax=Corynebacterium ulceribovis TaxID=487732 RepID=UPI0003723551|nr:MFS transporter [Corynebacterium ulceribovis]
MGQGNQAATQPGSAWEGHQAGTSGHRRVTITSFLAGLAAFMSMYATQALLPTLSDAHTGFGADAASVALTVSATTGMVALATMPLSILSERFGRGRVMVGGAMAAAIIGIVASFAPNLELLILGRAIQGLALAAVPAVAMAYLSEELHPDSLAKTMGLYVAATTVGGLTGRIIPAVMLEFVNWRWSMVAVGLVSLACAFIMASLMPPARRFSPKQLSFRGEALAVLSHWRQPRMVVLFAEAFLLMGGFVSLYNYVGFRLSTPPFGLSPSLVGIVFLIYLSGTYSSTRAGRIVQAVGRGPAVLIGIGSAFCGLLLTLFNHLAPMLIGMIIFTAGFFIAHSVASGWVGILAQRHRAEASSSYLMAYYGGSSILGYLVGFGYAAAGWGGVVAWTGTLYVIGFFLAGWMYLRSRKAA